MTDSLGHAISLSAESRHSDGPAVLDFSDDDSAILHCGDTLSIEVEIDPTFDPSAYEIEWQLSNIGGLTVHGHRLVLALEERHVSTRLCVICYVTSKAAWHKFRGARRLGRHRLSRAAANLFLQAKLAAAALPVRTPVPGQA